MSPIVGLIQSSNASSEKNTKSIHRMMSQGIKEITSQNTSAMGMRVENGGDNQLLILESMTSARNNAEKISQNGSSSVNN